MSPAEKALWFIESHLAEPLNVDEIARATGASPFHLLRAFSSAYGVSLIRYARRRRISEASKLLLNNQVRILDVALDAGYGSHEAFSRAFS